MKRFVNNTVFLAIICCLLWASAIPCTKIGLKFITPLQYAGFRFFIAGLLILPFFHDYKRYFKQVGKNFKFVILIAILQTVLIYSFLYSGQNLVPASLSAIFIGSYPLFVAVVAHFAMPEDKLNLHSIFGFLLGVTGIIVISAGRQISGIAGPKELLGIFFLIMTNLVGGFSNVLISRSKNDISPVVLSSSSMTLGGLILTLLSIPIEGVHPDKFAPAFYLTLAWLSIVSAIAFSIWFMLLKRPGVKVSYLNSWKFLIPVAGAILSWITIKNESPEIYSVLGVLIIVAALLVLNPDLFKRTSN